MTMFEVIPWSPIFQFWSGPTCGIKCSFYTASETQRKQKDLLSDALSIADLM